MDCKFHKLPGFSFLGPRFSSFCISLSESSLPINSINCARPLLDISIDFWNLIRILEKACLVRLFKENLDTIPERYFVAESIVFMENESLESIAEY